jgi:hypothetical protein
MAVQSFKRSIEAIKEARRYVEEQVQALERKREDLRRKKFQLSRAPRSRDEVLALLQAHIDAWAASFDQTLGAYMKRTMGIAAAPVAMAPNKREVFDRFNPLGITGADTTGGAPQLKADEPQLFALYGFLAPLLKDKLLTFVREMPWDENAVASEAARREELGKLHDEINQVSGEIEALVEEAKEAGIEL